MSAPPLGRDEAQRTIDVFNEVLSEGFNIGPTRPGKTGVIAETASRLGLSTPALRNRLRSARQEHDLEPDMSLARQPAPTFSVDDLPWDGEPTAAELIDALKERHATRKAYHDAAALYQVRVHVPGPVALAFFGDPHVDDNGCAWGDLERDVSICRDTPGIFAVDVGDDSNNWVGRLQRLYADQDVTSKQSLTLIEWLMTSLPWLLRIKGNHDEWNTEKGDPADFMHRGMPGILEGSGARLRLNLPGGAHATVHVRHDFSGQSQFNPAHALVRETLFGFRDHVLACGHRHTAGYMPIWHNDPKRLCHGMRMASYKDFDSYAKTKGFRDGAWARSMGVVIDPDYAHDPVRFIKAFFSLEEMAEYLTWRRGKWELGKAAA